MNKIELDADLLSLLPPWYRRILDYQQICQAEQAQMEALATEIAAVANNFFFQTMDAGAVSQWEQIFQITPNPATESLEFRRARVLNRASTRPPFTLQFLRQKLDELIGPGEWTITVDYPHYTLYIESSAENQQYATEVAYTIGRIKPAHIVFVNTPYLRAGLLLAEQIEYSELRYNYRLGTWGVGVLPFASEQPQGVIKMPDTPSIQEALLAGTANFVAADIVKARLNGTILIDMLNKEVDGSTLTITYSVPMEQVQEITKVELLDSTGTVLTTSTVYVPVDASTIIKHTIPVVEGVASNG
jgi:hypothetical protein